MCLAKTNMQDHARNLACKTCLARARDMSIFLHRFLHQILAKNVQETPNLNSSCSISCKILHHFLQGSWKICARLCKNRVRKGTYRVHVPSKSCMQDSCTILYDLASSFLLGAFTFIKGSQQQNIPVPGHHHSLIVQTHSCMPYRCGSSL